MNKKPFKQISSNDNPHQESSLRYLVWHELTKVNPPTNEKLLQIALDGGFLTTQLTINVYVSNVRRGLAHRERKGIKLIDGRSCRRDRKTRAKIEATV